MELSEIVFNYLKNNSLFVEALEIIKRNTSGGRIWVIGGMVYRPITSYIHNLRIEENSDVDFILEDEVDLNRLVLPDGWKLTKTSLGTPRLINGGKQIDFTPLSEISAKKRFGMEPKIENYLKQVPLTIQSIAFDLNSKTLIGEVGINSILRRDIQVNNLGQCKTYCQNHNLTIEKFIDNKRKSLGFE